MLKRLKLLPEARQIVRAVFVSLLAIGIVTYAIVIRYSQREDTMLLWGVFGLVGLVLLLQVWRVVSNLRRSSEGLRRAATEAEKHYVDVLRRIMRFVEARNKYAEGHSEHVGRLAGEIGGKLGLSRRKCELLSLAGELHDIGLLAIPEGILTKHGRLGVDEFRTIQKHSEVSYEILRPLRCLKEMLLAVRYHHERMNGTGYPAGISGDEIPLEAKILAVADAYDAMTHDRPHRPAMTPMIAVQELRRCTPHGYDESCVEALADIIHINKFEEAMDTSDKTGRT